MFKKVFASKDQDKNKEGVRFKQSNSTVPAAAGAFARPRGDDNDTHIAAGQYRPGSGKGYRLPENPLVQIIRQHQGPVNPTTTTSGQTVNSDTTFEGDAGILGNKFPHSLDSLGQPPARKLKQGAQDNTAGGRIIQRVKVKVKFSKGPQEFDTGDIIKNAMVYIYKRNLPKRLQEMITKKENGWKDAQKALNAIESAREEKSLKSSKLKVKESESGKIELVGRPAFTAKAKAMKVKEGEHRRHIIPHHVLKKAIEAAFNMPYMEEELYEKKESKEEESLPTEPKDISKIKNNAITFFELMGSGSLIDKSNSLGEIAKILLTFVNSNTKNLWPGYGYENIIINVFHKAIMDFIDDINYSKPVNDNKNDIIADLENKYEASKNKADPKNYEDICKGAIDTVKSIKVNTNEDLVIELEYIANSFDYDIAQKGKFKENAKQSLEIHQKLLKITTGTESFESLFNILGNFMNPED
jgi:hypothetical protein